MVTASSLVGRGGGRGRGRVLGVAGVTRVGVVWHALTRVVVGGGLNIQKIKVGQRNEENMKTAKIGGQERKQ